MKPEHNLYNPLRSITVLLVTAGCLLVDYLVLKLYGPKIITLHQSLALHFIPAPIIAIASIPFLTRSRTAGWLLFLATLQAAFGLLGIIGFVATILFRQHFIYEESHQQTLMNLLAPHKETPLAERLIQSIHTNPDLLKRDIEIMPFRDRIHLGDSDQKRAVLTHIGNSFSPAFTPIIKECMQNSDASVRVQAATIMTKVSHRFQDQLIEAQRRCRDAPTDEEALLALARASEAYAFSGTVDGAQEKQLYQEAIRSYRHYLQARPEATEATLAYGRLLLRAHHDEDAFEVLHCLWKQEEEGKKSAVATWLMEACYRTGRYSCLRLIAKATKEEAIDELPVELQEAVTLWTGSKLVTP